MRVLVIGSGAREHALVRSLAADPDVDAVTAAPGNPGIAQVATCAGLPLGMNDGDGIADLAAEVGADLVVIGPEAPLVAGVADVLRARGIACFGPSGAAAQLEGSKSFAKEVMAAAGVPTARSHVCTSPDEVAKALDALGPPYVVKADGLAAGKGVVVTSDRDEALEHGRRCLAAGDGPGQVGSDGSGDPDGPRDEARLVVEEFLDGPEVSLFCITDGTAVVPLALAQDFKRLGDGDAGPNTGGMGAYSPLDWAPAGLVQEVVDRVARPTVEEMRRHGMPFVGVLYIGLALTARGPRVVEFNARFGDPETQVLLARLLTPLGRILLAAATGRLDEVGPLRWRREHAVGVVVAAEGYPVSPRTGDPIAGLGEVDALPATYVLHAGTAAGPDGALVSAGGRVLTVVAVGADLHQARERAYQGVGAVRLDGSRHRTDIALAADRGEVVVPAGRS